MSEQELREFLISLGFYEWPKSEQEWFCYNMAALLHANKAGATGNNAVVIANAFLADHGRKPLPADLAAKL